jgi:hypothetical protein
MVPRYLLAAALILLGLSGPGLAEPVRFSAGIGLGILDLNGLGAAWGVSEGTAQLLQGVVEIGPLSGLGVRFAAEFGLPSLGSPEFSKFETAILFHIPGRDARLYLGGGTGLLIYRSRLDFAIYLSSGLKKDLPGALTVFLDAKLIGVLELHGPRLIPEPPLQFTAGVALFLAP